MTLPETTALTLSRESGVLHITLNRPEARNAMSLAMVNELMDVFDWLENDAGGAGVRALVLRGADGHFCAGGDIKDMAGARQQAAEGDPEAFLRLNRRFGEMISTATFLGCGVFIFLYSMELFDMGQLLRAYIGLAAALFCVLGGFRFTIANLVNKWRGN